MADRSFEENGGVKRDYHDAHSRQQASGEVAEGDDKQVPEQSRFSPDTVPTGEETKQTAEDRKESRFEDDNNDTKPVESSNGNARGKKDMLRGLLRRIAFWKKPNKLEQGLEVN